MVKIENDNLEIAGFIDFGDVLQSKIVCDLAICCAYIGMFISNLDENPLPIIVKIVKGYETILPLNAAEKRALLPLMLNRAAVSVTHSALNHKKGLNDPYLYAFEAQAWAFLRKMYKLK